MIERIVAYQTEKGKIFRSRDDARRSDCADTLAKLYRRDRGPSTSIQIEGFEWIAANWIEISKIMESYRGFTD